MSLHEHKTIEYLVSIAVGKKVCTVVRVGGGMKHINVHTSGK